MLRTVLYPVTGDLADTRTRYFGLRPVKFFRVMSQNHEAIFAIFPRTWLSYSQNHFHLTQLS
jgi:splicing factor 3B subunit 3